MAGEAVSRYKTIRGHRGLLAPPVHRHSSRYPACWKGLKVRVLPIRCFKQYRTSCTAHSPQFDKGIVRTAQILSRYASVQQERGRALKYILNERDTIWRNSCYGTRRVTTTRRTSTQQEGADLVS